MTLESVALLVAGVGLLAVAIAALVTTRSHLRLHRAEHDLRAAQTLLAEKLTDMERVRHGAETQRREAAHVTARLVQYEDSGVRRYRLILHNLGEAAAKGVDYALVATDPSSPPPRIFEGADLFPLSKLDPGQRFFLSAMPVGDGNLYKVELKWSDEEGTKSDVVPVSLEKVFLTA